MANGLWHSNHGFRSTKRACHVRINVLSDHETSVLTEMIKGKHQIHELMTVPRHAHTSRNPFGTALVYIVRLQVHDMPIRPLFWLQSSQKRSKAEIPQPTVSSASTGCNCMKTEPGSSSLIVIPWWSILATSALSHDWQPGRWQPIQHSLRGAKDNHSPSWYPKTEENPAPGHMYVR